MFPSLRRMLLVFLAVVLLLHTTACRQETVQQGSEKHPAFAAAATNAPVVPPRSTPGMALVKLPEQFQARIEPGAETDPVALYHALGLFDIPNRDMLPRWRGRLYPLEVEGVALRHPQAAGLFRVQDKEFFPAAAVHSFVVLQDKAGAFYAFNQTNFAIALGPVLAESEALPRARAFLQFFGTSSSVLSQHQDTPETTRVVESGRHGYTVRLLYEKFFGRRTLCISDLFVGRNGWVSPLENKTLKDLGDGIVM